MLIAPGPSVIFSGYVTPSVTPSDSPEYTAEAKARSTDDKDFMAIYTYTEFEIILDATGLPPVASGIPQPSGTDLPEIPCMEILEAHLSWMKTSYPCIDFYGRITITLGGATYQWSTSGQSCTITPAASPVTIPKVSKMLEGRKRTEELADELIVRVPLRLPAGLVSYTKLDYTLGEGNLCEGLSDWWDLSPLDFGGACNVQILYYDMCEDFSWVGCNAILYIATLAVCSEVIGNDRWDVAALIACGVQAAYYTAVAETNTGCALYYKAPNAVCRCFCSGPLPTRHLDCGVSPSKRATWE
ncbi:hypothetical protein TruAng_007718 [Truncatella angustata]|nr:hypothetical protein TruAng_007718 [Truncatella angustata]